MLLVDIFRISTRSFKNNRLRTALTVLGIGIGIGVIFFLVSLGYGFQKLIIDKIATSDSLLTMDIIQESKAFSLNEESIKKIKDIEGVTEVSSVVIQESQMSKSGFVSDLKTNIVDHNFLRLEGITLKSGRKFEENESDGIIVSSAILQLLNLSEDNLSDRDSNKVSLKILTERDSTSLYYDFVEKEYLIVGVIEDDLQTFAYINKKSVEDIDLNKYDKIKVKVASEEILEGVREKIIGQGYHVSAISDLVNQAKQIFKVSQIILALFGIVALIVSAIGMFNTMTITLLERTQEIGIMKTLGASSFVIWKLFLVESIAIGFSGGVMGLIVGYSGSKIFNFAINMLAKNFGGMSVELFYIPTWFVFFILIFSVLVGAITGLYPAKRASRLNALEALRYK